MAVEMPDRVIQILGYINANTAGQEVTLYTPGFVNLRGTQIGYNGFLGCLRVVCKLPNQGNFMIPIDSPDDTTAERQIKAEMIRSAPRVGISLYLRRSGVLPVIDHLVATADLVNFGNQFKSSLFEDLTDLELYGIQRNVSLIARIENRGHGILQTDAEAGNDEVFIHGYVLERAAFLQDADLTVYAYT